MAFFIPSSWGGGEKKKKEGRGLVEKKKKKERVDTIRYLEEQSVHDDANLVANSSTIPNRSRRSKIRSLTEPNSIIVMVGWIWARPEGVERQKENKERGGGRLQID